jgi:hypothetical protein
MNILKNDRSKGSLHVKGYKAAMDASFWAHLLAQVRSNRPDWFSLRMFSA